MRAWVHPYLIHFAGGCVKKGGAKSRVVIIVVACDEESGAAIKRSSRGSGPFVERLFDCVAG